MLLPSSDRKTLRQQGRRARRALTTAARRRGTTKINKRLVRHCKSSQRIALSLAFDGEPDLLPAITALLKQDKLVYLPQLTKRGMRFVSIRALAKGRSNRYGIVEPHKSATTISSKRLQAIVLPLTVFDTNGNRLGMGAGYYDQNLAWRLTRNRWYGPKLIGCAWAAQEAAQVPHKTWDIPLDAICHEQRWISFTHPQPQH